MSAIDVVRPDIRQAKAYAVTDVPADFIKLDAMESPYDYGEEMQKALAEQLSEVPIRLYPHPQKSNLLPLLRQIHHIPAEADLVLGNGSDELIERLTMLVSQPGATVVAPAPSFVMYRVNAEFFGMTFVGVPLKPDFTLDVDAVLDAIRKYQPALVFLAYPNNPTGGRFEREQVEAVIQATPGIVVVDEAYGAFSSDSFVREAGLIPNLVVLRTFSKIGFAGLRVGYAAGAPAVIHELRKVIPPYNVSQLNLAAAEFAIQYQPFILQHINQTMDERERMRTALRCYAEVEDFPSEANFLTIRVPDAQALFDKLYANKILIKNLHGTHPLLDQCVRITIGLPEQNQLVLGVIDELYGHEENH